MYYYFKDKNNGAGISNNKNVDGDIIWITKEEFEIIVAENEAKEKARLEAEEAAAAQITE